MEWGRLFCCLCLIVVWDSVSAIETLHKIEDLKNKEFGRKYPRHGLLLLHWLASHVSIDQSEDILLHFDPVRQDYGFHDYKNTSNDKNTLPRSDDSLDRAYYCLGSLSSEAVRTKLPPHITQDFYNAHQDPKRDLDRIVVQVQKNSPSRADKVYITEAVNKEQGEDYDPDKTFEISPKLLRQVQALQKPLDLIQALEKHVMGTPNSTNIQSDDPRLALTRDQLLTHLKHSEKRLKTIFEEPGMRWLLSLAGYDIGNRYEIHKKTWSCLTDEPIQHEQSSSDPETLCEGHSTVKIEVKSTQKGYARIMWSGLPKNIIELNPTLVLFSSDTSSALETFESIRGKTSGFADTSVALNHGLNPRLVTSSFANEYGFISLRYSVIWRGPQFDQADRMIPTEITGYNASLQLYTRNGYACARLYIKNSFTDWENEFANSWVGFYASDQDHDHQYNHYQWVSKFEKVCHEDDWKEYLIYEYESSMSIGPGVQARFLFLSEHVYTRIFFRWSSVTVKARTVPWENVHN